MNGRSSEAMLLNESVWLSQVLFSNAEEAFYCSKFGTEGNKQRTKSPGPVHFDSSADKKYQSNKGNKQNKNRRNSKSPHQQQRYVTTHNGYSGNVNYINNPPEQYHRSSYQQNYLQNGCPLSSAAGHHYQQQQNYHYYGVHASGAQHGAGGGAKYYRNNQYYNQYTQHPHYQHQQFGELKQHIAQARQTIQRALRHSGNRNSGGGGGNCNWGELNSRRSGSRNSTGAGEQHWYQNNNSDNIGRPKRSSNRNSHKNKNANANQSNNSEFNKNRNSFSQRKRTVSFEDTVSGELTLRIKQLEEEKEQLHKIAISLEGQVGRLSNRVKLLESAISGKKN